MKMPAPFATAGVELSMFWGMLIAPHSVAAEGRWTSARTAVPETPRAGVMIACALAWRTRPRQSATEEMRLLENMATNRDE